MNRFVAAFALMLLSLAGTADAASQPTITGHISGTELCAQFICGFAAFTGDYQGKVGGKGAKGTFLVEVNHDSPLNTSQNGVTAITGGSWIINTTRGSFLGHIEPGGTLTYLGNDLFAIDATLAIDTGGSGTITVDATLSHQGLPFVLPTIWGDLSQ